MTTLRQHAEEYLAMRRALGFKLTTQGALLLDFIGYCERLGTATLTAQAALDWAVDTPTSTNQVWWSRRLMVVRIFARHLKALEEATEIPPADMLPHHYCRQVPYLYSPAEITALLRAVGTLTPASRAATWRTLLGLLAATGLRIGEACRLDRDDVDLDNGILTIRNSKFGKSRHVPVHVTTVEALRAYDQERSARPPAADLEAFFVSTRGTRLDHTNTARTFRILTDTAGIRAPEGRRYPRIHDLRHSFTVATLLRWYRDGGDVQARLPLLSTYLGHADPKSTYWYLSGAPELLTLAATRLDGAFGGTP
jgi:integrase/recombinase XerD